MPSDERQQKWQQRYSNGVATEPAPCGVLSENAFLLPRHGGALDLACGWGGNALFLARHGLDTEGWDYAPAAIERLNMMAHAQELRLKGVLRDVEEFPPEPQSFDVITVSYFLDRAIVPNLIEALRPGGLIFYETFLRDAVSDEGPGNSAFRLADNELLQMFSGLRVISYTEHGSIGEVSAGVRNVARLVAAR